MDLAALVVALNQRQGPRATSRTAGISQPGPDKG